MMEESRQPGVAAHDLDSCQISRIQNILKDKGFDAGPADGILGPKTSQALRRFQGSEGLAVTGKPDTETLRTLAPDTGVQEYFGISPEFDEKEMVEEQPRRRGEDYGEIERMFDY
jgi:peptidoglycan hydrolase-like protein with peptidoglycan-binding domain